MNTAAPSATSLFSALRRFWWIAIGCGILAAALGFVGSGFQATRYEATANILVEQAQNRGLIDPATKVDPIRSLLNEVERMRSPEILDPAATKLGGTLGTPEALRKHVKAASAPTFDLIKVTGMAETSQESARIANAVVEAYSEVKTGQRRTAIEEEIRLKEELKARRQSDVDAMNARISQIVAQTNADVLRFLRVPGLVIEEVNRRIAANPEHQQLTAQRTAATESINTLTEEVDRQKIDLALLDSGVDLFETAVPPRSPVQPKPARNALLSGVVGLLAGAGIAWWQADRLAPAGRTGATGVLGVPELGELPAGHHRRKRTAVDLSGNSPLIGAGRLIAAALAYRLAPAGGRIVLVTGPQKHSGRTIAVLSSAIAVARTGRRVLIVDADSAATGVGALIGHPNVDGLPTVLGGSAPTERALRSFPYLDIGAIDVLVAGSSSGSFSGPGPDPEVDQEFVELVETYDLVLIDAPALGASPGALELARLADAVVLVVATDSPAAELSRARDRLLLVGATLGGFISNAHGIDARSRRVDWLGTSVGRAVSEVPGLPAPSVSTAPAREIAASTTPAPAAAASVKPVSSEGELSPEDVDLQAVIRRVLRTSAGPPKSEPTVNGGRERHAGRSTSMGLDLDVVDRPSSEAPEDD